MHMRRRLPVVCCHPSQQRGAATAANLKPPNWDHTGGPTSSSSRPPFSSRFPRPQSSKIPGNNDYAFRPNTASSSRTSQAPPWPPKAQETNKPMPSFDISGRPPSIARPPPASAMNKWARPVQLKVPRASSNIRASPPHIPQSSLNVNQATPSTLEKPTQTNALRSVSESSTPHPLGEDTHFNRSSFSSSTERRNVYNIRQAFKERGSVVSGVQRGGSKPVVKRPSSPSTQLTAKKIPRFLEKRVSKDIFIPSVLSVDTLARLLDVKLERLQRKMRQAGLAKEATYDHVLTSDYAVLLAEEFGRNPIVDDEAAFDLYPPAPITHSALVPPRPPVVTIMGHVDHGKTTLLDTLRSACVAKGEAGGITQHIGAFSVPVPGAPDGSNSITFLDTPGHAAFSAMRARGAGVTDIIVLVVAADDGIMPQTKEVLELFKKDGGKVGLVIAINKVDKPGVDTEAVQRALLAEGIQIEPYGGDIPCVHVSGMTGHGLPVLMETLSAMSEVQDLRAERQGAVYGHLLESKIQKGLGPVATVLVLRGCLEVGTHIISGTSSAKVRLMNDSAGKSVKKAYPGMAVTVSGWKPLPNAGDEVLSGTESNIKKAIANRARKAEMEASLIDLEAINASRREERLLRASADQTSDRKAIPRNGSMSPVELRLVVKADVSGSIEAVVGALQEIGSSKATTKIVATGVGDISESDILMAKATNATLVGFSVSSSRAIETLASQNAIPIVASNIIYRLVESVQERLIALLPSVIETKVIGEASVIQLFEIQLKAKQIRKIAGCRVINGTLEKTKFVRVVRRGETIFDGSLDTLRQLKKDVIEVRKGSECGLSLDGFTDLREGDLLQSYSKIEKPGSL